MTTKMTQKALILKHLLRGMSLTPLEALNRFGCFRLGARIYDLRREGYTIDRTIDKKRHFAVYKLELPA